MEVDENNFKPSSLKKLLQQQVNEQSEFCDVVVKVGHWERRYHKLVLLSCPFFECVFRNDFLEKHSGIIHLKRGTPSNVDIALMYLYGKQPKLTDDNIGAVMDLAEFFMIPNLKSACIKWLNSKTVSEDNCMHLLQLSSLYDFDLPKCHEYLNGHLVDMLKQESALNITCESVNYIFTEKKFSYLPMEERLQFLFRWYKAQSKCRFPWVEKFLKTIIFEEIPLRVENEMKTDVAFSKLLSGISAGRTNPDDIISVCINLKWQKALCFDLTHNRWFQIVIPGQWYSFDTNITDTDTKSPVVYLTETQSYAYKVIALNLETGKEKDFEVVTEFEKYGTRFDRIHFGCSICVGYITERVKSIKKITNAPKERLRLMPPRGSSSEAVYRRVFLNAETKTTNFVSTVSIGYFSGEHDEIQMIPTLSLKEESISLLAVNTFSAVAIITAKREHLFIYDLVSCSLTKLDVKTTHADNIFPAEQGFVIHNNQRCISITRLSGPDLSQQYEVKTLSLSSKNLVQKQHYFCSNIWFRYFCEDYDSDFQFQYVRHNILQAASSPDDIEWTDLSLPMEASNCSLTTLQGKLHLVGLPRRMLRCHPECPHCDAKQKERSIFHQVYYARRVDSEEEHYYDSDTDSDEYGYEYGGYDYDDYYYDYSD